MSTFIALQGGSIEVICGPMFSGKSEELIRRLRLAVIARQRVQVFKPGIDRRYADEQLVSHSDFRIQARCMDTSEELLEAVDPRTQVVGVDEVQFFDEGVVQVCEKLADMGKRVIVAGLDMDYRGQPFHPIPELMAIAEFVTKSLAVCMRCGAPANRSQRLVGGGALVEVGSSDRYEARCRRCFEPEELRQLELAAFISQAMAVPKRNDEDDCAEGAGNGSDGPIGSAAP